MIWGIPVHTKRWLFGVAALAHGWTVAPRRWTRALRVAWSGDDIGAFILPLVLAMVAGLTVRLVLLLNSSFPLNDGGMFYTMAQDIQNNDYALPTFSTYNHAAIPFAYPPLGLYLVAIVEQFTPLDMVNVFRWVPLFFNILTIPLVFLMARAVLGRGLASAMAVIIFVVFPRSYMWFIVGGGVTRSVGFFFAIGALYCIYEFYTRRNWRFLQFSVVFAALAILSHPEIAWFTAFSIALFFLMRGLHWKGVAGTIILAGGATVITAPWWATVIFRHGLAPFQAAAHPWSVVAYRYESLNSSQSPITGASALLLLAVFSGVGVFVAIFRRNFLTPLWLLEILVLAPRSSLNYATVPMAMLSGITVASFFIPGRMRAPLQYMPWADQGLSAGPRLGQNVLSGVKALMPRLALSLLLLLLYGYALVVVTRADANVLTSVSPQDLSVMKWVTANTPTDAKFVVMTNSDWWAAKAAEWFPTITGRQSIATVQGTEWLGAFEQNIIIYYRLRVCTTRDVECVENWSRDSNHDFSYVYVSKSCCSGAFVNSLQKSDKYVKVYESEGATVFARRTDQKVLREQQSPRPSMLTWMP